MKKLISALLMACLLMTTAALAETAHTHVWGEWIPEAESANHTGVCSECGESKTVKHYTASVTIADKTRSVCLICGNSAVGTFALVEGASAVPVAEKPKTQRGEFVVRDMAAPWAEDPSVLYAFTLLYANNGSLATFKNQVTVSLPIAAELPQNVKLVRVRSSAGDDSVQNPEVWIDMESTFEDGVLTFKTQTPSVYLVMAAE